MIAVGLIHGTHGLNGELKVESRTDFPDLRFVPGSRLFLLKKNIQDEGLAIPVVVEAASVYKRGYLLSFVGYRSITAVETWQGGTLKVPESEMPKLPEGEYYIRDLLECHVYDEMDNRIGVVTNVLTPGANDVYEVKADDGKLLLIPAIKECILSVEPDKKRMTIHVMPGLFDES
ncbi:ribosome maturation factor RimM [Ferroacidibacillus organovorans]|uniref:Ribosome maturation factor RimM n=1 Tax=Ferroacidibacillus organovorans TaxID=1765683 RepID=A0A162T781_9BACL|nr:ribosome maturation factor RimM [Ferroacidibacillus organovorans]KYP80536.1 hypothetical protein AYJ22_11010 [Ferroacidibacillus organovorans]OAG93397.1 hypothetical protein AYW79_10950 [Ferroacidibacillus organovorans]OPG16152.1 hypothetical protein B2M26_07485 [Ferroacidibacillus organovorans]